MSCFQSRLQHPGILSNLSFQQIPGRLFSRSGTRCSRGRWAFRGTSSRECYMQSSQLSVIILFMEQKGTLSIEIISSSCYFPQNSFSEPCSISVVFVVTSLSSAVVNWSKKVKRKCLQASCQNYHFLWCPFLLVMKKLR